MSSKKTKKRKPKLFDFEHAYKVELPVTALISFQDTNYLTINIEGMKPKDIDLELNMFLSDGMVTSITLNTKCGCISQYDNYGVKKKDERCDLHAKFSDK